MKSYIAGCFTSQSNSIKKDIFHFISTLKIYKPLFSLDSEEQQHQLEYFKLI